MNVPDYQVGDLVILKPGFWKDDVVRTGVITELMFHSELDRERRSFLVLFTNVHRLVQNRIVWHNDIEQHFPVVK